MLGWKKSLLAVLGLFLVLAVGSCTSDSLDDGDTADVILEILSFENPAVTAQRQQSTQGSCSVSGNLCDSNADCAQTEVCLRTQECTLEVQDWSANIQNSPKNALASGPFNDVVMTTVNVSYQWVNPVIFTPDRVIGLGNVVIPSMSANQITFPPITSDDLNANPAIEGATATLTLTFNGRTIEGTSISQTAIRQLVVEVCN